MNMILTNGSKYYPLRFQVTREIDTVLPQTKGSRLMLSKVLTDYLYTQILDSNQDIQNRAHLYQLGIKAF